MGTDIVLSDGSSLLLSGAEKDKHIRSRVTMYLDWANERGSGWLQPRLKDYANYLIEERGLSPASVNSYLSTIRSRYTYIMNTESFRSMMYSQMPAGASFADKKSMVDEIERQIEIGISARHSSVKQIVVQDESDRDHIRLTKHQANMLLEAPGTDTLKGLRDTSMLAIALCTGVRVDELRSLDVDDLNHSLNDEPALLVREGKGGKQRLIPYGDSDWCLVVTRFWLDNAGITEGAIFRPFWKGSKRTRDARITTRSIERIVAQYPVSINGDLVQLEPHDLRRTYARLMYESGMDVVAIQQNLGHSNMETTLRYIGDLDAGRRRAPSLYRFNLSNLRSVP